MINPDREGHQYQPAAPYQVSREAIREFALAVQAGHPAHHDLDAAQALGHRDLIAPPSFAVVIAQRAEAAVVNDEEAGIDFSRVVHAEQAFDHHRPITAGDRLHTAVQVAGITERAGITMVTTRTEIADDDGEPVCAVTSTLAVRGEGR